MSMPKDIRDALEVELPPMPPMPDEPRAGIPLDIKRALDEAPPAERARVVPGTGIPRDVIAALAAPTAREEVEAALNVPTVGPMDRGFFGKMGERWRRAKMDLRANQMMKDAVIWRKGSVEQAMRLKKTIADLEAVDPVEGNWFTGLFYGLARIVPQILAGAWAGKEEAAIGAGAALALGQLGPQVGLPEEIVSVPTGAYWGWTTGAARYWWGQGAGEMLHSMAAQGLDTEQGKWVAGIAAIPYAAIEFIQLSHLLPGAKRAAAEVVRQSATKALAQLGKKYLGTLTKEAIEEGLQEVVQITAEDLAAHFQGHVGRFSDPNFWRERLLRAGNVTVGSMYEMALLPVPGTAIAGARQVALPYVEPGTAASLPSPEGAEVPPDARPTEVPDILEAYHQEGGERLLEADIQGGAFQQDIAAALNKPWQKLARAIGIDVRVVDRDVERADEAIHWYNSTRQTEAEGGGTPAEQWAAFQAAYEERWERPVPEDTVTLWNESQALSPALRAVADRLAEANRETGQYAVDNHILKEFKEFYAARLWRHGRAIAGERRKFGTWSGRLMPRTRPSILDGFLEGDELRVKGATNAFRIARQEIVKVVRSRQLIKSGLKVGSLSTKREGADWRLIEHMGVRAPVVAGRVDLGHRVEPMMWTTGEPGIALGVPPSEVTTYRPDLLRTDEEKGTQWVLARLYAPAPLANKINNMLGKSALLDPGKAGETGARFFQWLTDWTALLKSIILFTSLFHPQAFLRSFYFGARAGAMSPRESFRQGWAAIQEFGPELRRGARMGLTLGQIADYNEEVWQRKTTAIGKAIDKLGYGHVKDAVLDWRARQTDFIFRRVGAPLKAMAYLLEYRHTVKAQMAALEAGTITHDEIARDAAGLVNADFGGLNLERMYRNPTMQHIMRLLLLAPDWTESNVRTMVKAFTGSKAERAMYQKFWGRVIAKAMGATVLLNLLLAGFDDDDFVERYRKAWKAGRLRWLDIDVTPIYRAMGGEKNRRKYFSLIGHFRDPVKFVRHPIRSLKHKGSVLTRILHDALSGHDWAGRSFTTWSELLGVGKPETRIPRRRPTLRERLARARRRRKYAGRIVKWEPFAGGPIGYEQLPSYMAYELRGAMPVQVQSLMALIAGEMDAFDAVGRGMGFMTASWNERTGARQ